MFGFLSRRRSHMSGENGSSILLSSMILLATKVPASLKTLQICLTFSWSNPLRCIGRGKRRLSVASFQRLLSRAFLTLSAKSEKKPRVGPRPVPASFLKFTSSCLVLSKPSMKFIASSRKLFLSISNFWIVSFLFCYSSRA